MLRRALLNIYSKEFRPVSDIEIDMFNEAWRTMDLAVSEVFGHTPDSDSDFIDALRHSGAVFAAFKVHRAQNDMARLLLDSDGVLKPFEQWSREVTPIASHQMGPWLRTEYDTAVLRASRAADWRQFEREKDVLPNLRWMPSTSVRPGEDHRRFWGTVRPIDDPFWDAHRPGDRWNCKCSLSSTDDPATPAPAVAPGDNPQPGLENNPGKDPKLFSDKHPYISDAHTGAKGAVDKLMERIREMIDELPDSLSSEEKNAIVRDNLNIEKALGVTKGKPMTIEDADKQSANPNYVPEYILDPEGRYYDPYGNRLSKNTLYDPSKHYRFEVNCQTCAPAYALRLRGFNVTAKGNTPGSKLEYLSSGFNCWKVWKNIDGSPAEHTGTNSWMNSKGYKKMTPKRYLEFFNETCREVGVYELSIGWKRRGGHATIIQRFEDGSLKYIEPQSDNSNGSGYEYKNIEYLANEGAALNHDCRGIMRVDNKLFNVDFVDIFEI